MASTTTLTSLAMLKVNKDVRNTDYIDYLRPFVVEVLRTHRPDPIQDHVVADFLNSDFGLRVPNRGVHLVLGRLQKRGIVARQDGLFRLGSTIPDEGLASRRGEAQRRIDVLMNQIVDFAKAECDVIWTVEKAAEVVKSYLSTFGIECLRTYVHQTALPEIQKKVPKDLRVVHSFARDAYRSSIERFDNFILVVKGHMLANALLCPDLQSLQQKFDRVTFYLDTGFLLRALGLSSDAENAAAKELLELLRSLRGRLAVFDHTVDELLKVLRSAESNFSKKGLVPRIVQVLRQRGETASDIALVRSGLDNRLTNLHVERRNAPRHLVEFQIDESILEDVLEDEVGYLNPNARLHDLDCIRCIFTLRQESRPVRLEDSSAVFVTTNTSLARAAFNFGKQFEHSREVSAVITDFSLANVAWLKAPLGAPNLPEREVLAACYAALEPPTDLWEKYLTEVDKLQVSGQISEHDHAFLRHDLVAREELVSLTGGELEGLSAETIPEVLERAKAAIVSEERAKTGELAEKHQRLREQQAGSIARVYWISQKTGKCVAWVLTAIFVVATFVLAGVVPKTWRDTLDPQWFVGAAFGGLLLVGIVLGLIDNILGHSVRELHLGIQDGVSAFTFRSLTKMLKLAPPE